MISSPTSHLLGFPIDSSYFVDIFFGLSEILGKSGDIVEFQNITSLHVTIGYLPEILPDTADKILEHFSQENISFSFSGCGIFGNSTDPKVYYLLPSSKDIFTKNNSIFLDLYPELKDFGENQLSFVPHMTLFRILDRENFLKKRGEVEIYLQKELINISKTLFSSSFSLFVVDSRIHPELQICIS